MAKNHEVVTKPPKQPTMRSANKGALASPGRSRSKPVASDGGTMNSGPMTSAGEGKPPGNRNFGKDDHHGTTNVRSRHIINAVGGPGGTKHISGQQVRPAAIGPYARTNISPGNTAASPPWGHGPNDQDADDRESPDFHTVPIKMPSGGFS